MVRQHHQLYGHESEQTLGDCAGQRSMAWGCRVRHDLATEQQQIGHEGLILLRELVH